MTRTYLELPQVSETTATHAAVDDEAVSVVHLAGVGDTRV